MYEWDAFISYSHKDCEWAEGLAKEIRKRKHPLTRKKLNVFRDRDHIEVGQNWITTIGNAVKNSHCIIPIYSKSYFESEASTWELYQKLLVDLDSQDRLILPCLIEDCEIPSILKHIHYLDFRYPNQGNSPLPEMQLELLIKAIRSAITTHDNDAKHKQQKTSSSLPEKGFSEDYPYLGLSPFKETDSKFFFGRNALIDELAAQLRCNPRFLAIVGSSGSGKSSVVQAGLLPILRRGDVPGFEDVKVISFRPGSDPQEALRQAIQRERISISDDPWQAILYYQEQNPIKRLVIFADQFEELFAYSKEPRRIEFLNGLSKILRNKMPITLILTIRADFYDPILSSPLGGYLRTSQINVFPMTKGEMRDAIFKPAEVAGLMIEAGIEDRILEDLKGTKNPLPLLECALYQLWDRRSKSGLLTNETYNKIGGAAGAVSQWATETFNQLTPIEQELSKRVFMRLIHYGQGDMPDSRRRIFSSEIASIGDEEAIYRLITKLADSRLLITDRDLSIGFQTVEIVHEALIREWRQLEEWINKNRKFLLWRQQLDEKINEWENRRREEFSLLRGSFLDEAEELIEKQPDDFNPTEQEYIKSSLEWAKANLDRDKKLAEELARLNKAKDELELRVEERTKELALANAGLSAEIAERIRAEEIIKASLQEKEVLLREIHFRVKNNLQIVSSLLYLQSRSVTDEDSAKIFKESQNRVKSMALIHEKLYRSENLARVDFADYIRNLVAYHFMSYGVASGKIDLHINIDEVLLGIDTAIPCGLIVNELVSNSLKHAFPDPRKGEISIDLHSYGDSRFKMVVTDNGIGFKDGMDFKRTQTLGLQLVNTLVKQIDGKIKLDTRNGSRFEIDFNELKYKDRI